MELKVSFFLTAILPESTAVPPVSSKSNLKDTIPDVLAASLSLTNVNATNSPSVSFDIVNLPVFKSSYSYLVPTKNKFS